MNTALRIRDGGAYIPKEQMLAQMNRPSNSNLCIEDPLQPGITFACIYYMLLYNYYFYFLISLFRTKSFEVLLNYALCALMYLSSFTKNIYRIYINIYNKYINTCI